MKLLCFVYLAFPNGNLYACLYVHSSCYINFSGNALQVMSFWDKFLLSGTRNVISDSDKGFCLETLSVHLLAKRSPPVEMSRKW